MADDKKPAEPKKPAASGGNPPNMILIILFIFVAAFGGTFLAFQLAPKTITVNQTVEEHREPQEGDLLPVMPIGDFVVNLADVSGSRFLKLSMTAKLYSENFEEYAHLEAEKKEAYHKQIEEEVGHNMAAIKDTVITTLSRKTSEEVVGYENKIALKEELKEQLNKVMHGEFKIYDIYFTDFIVQ
ncbi:MAG: flagellar basal body-associated FliL family protein [Candidatus Caenarcaniphilales bacterium]|jgi:flagellar FliL protein|nr:flagellar basal body-associated FliL family protein [Candidatus Caenarcaniphilales bacterium]